MENIKAAQDKNTGCGCADKNMCGCAGKDMCDCAAKQGFCICGCKIWHRGAPLVTLDAKILPGEVLTLMGASGCGKSTFLSALIGALAADFDVEGQFFLNGVELSALPVQARRIGILFQDDLLFPHMSVGANLAFGLPRQKGQTRAMRREMIEDALDIAGIAGFFARDPATLSGGQRARVALMRVLLSEPQALLLDEPFSKLDTALRGQMRDFVFSHAKRRNLPVILVTHDPLDAEAAGGQVRHL